ISLLKGLVFLMPPFTVTWTDAIVLVIACIAYATFLWVNFRAGRYVMLWSSAGIVLIQAISAIGSANTPAYLAAAGFHAALVASVYTATRKPAKTPAHQTVSTKE